MTGRPALTDCARPSTSTVEAIDEHGRALQVAVAAEEPLTLYLDKRELVTLMTLGAAPEHLALGYLRGQRFVERVDEIASVQVDWQTNSVAVTTRGLRDDGVAIWDRAGGAGLDARILGRRTVTTGCGQGTVFGDVMQSLERIELPPRATLSEAVLQEVLEAVRRHESIYKLAGAVHGCALCSNTGDDRGAILRFVEDVGRHNAVDAIAGWMWMGDVAGGDKIFYTTGRLTSEMVIKCAQLGIPFLLSRSGITRMGYDIAQRLGLTMIGRCQGRHYLVFTGAGRFIRAPSTALA